MREFIQKNGLYIVIATLVLAGAAYFVSMRSAGHIPNQAFFIDEESNEELVQANTNVPPLMGKGGKETVVEVCKYSCDGGKTGKIAYYFKFTPEMKKKLEGTPVAERGNIDAGGGELVRAAAAGSKWVSIRSEEGQQITSNISCPEGHDVQWYVP